MLNMNQKYMGSIYKIIGFAAILLFIHLPVYGQSNYPSYEAGFQAGLDLFNKGLYEAAIPLLDESSRKSEYQLMAETACYFLARVLYIPDNERADEPINSFVKDYRKATVQPDCCGILQKDRLSRGFWTRRSAEWTRR